MAVADPEKNPLQSYKHAEKQNARIIAVFEMHPHADFVSSHLQEFFSAFTFPGS
mgnify:CR=1 FL=1